MATLLTGAPWNRSGDISATQGAWSDALIGAARVDAINDLVGSLGLEDTWLSSDLMTMPDELAVEVGYADFEALAAVEPGG